MSIKIAASGPFLDVLVTDVLAEADLPALFSAMETARRKGPFVVLTDTLAMKSAPRPVIMAFIGGLKQLPSMKDTWLGDAVVVRSPLTRFVVSTLIMAAPLPTDVQVFEKRDRAELWCALILMKAGVSIPAPLKKYA